MYYLGWESINLQELGVTIISMVFKQLGNLLNNTKITYTSGCIFSIISEYLVGSRPLSITRPRLIPTTLDFNYPLDFKHIWSTIK